MICNACISRACALRRPVTKRSRVASEETVMVDDSCLGFWCDNRIIQEWFPRCTISCRIHRRHQEPALAWPVYRTGTSIRGGTSTMILDTILSDHKAGRDLFALAGNSVFEG